MHIVWRVELAIVEDGMCVRRGRGPRKGRGRVEMRSVRIKALVWFLAGARIEAVLSDGRVSPLIQQKGGGKTGGSGLEEAAPCTSTWKDADRLPRFWKKHTGGDVVKFSEPAELECEGVRGVMLAGNW